MTTSPTEHSHLSREQDMGTLLMLILQVNLQSPHTDPSRLQFGNSGKIMSIEFDQQLATVDGKPKVVPDLTALLITTDKGLYGLEVRPLDG